MSIVEAYAKAEGKFDWAMCEEMMERGEDSWTEAEKDANSIKAIIIK